MMERLTKRTDNGDAWYNHRPDKTVYNDDLLQRLAYYEDMEEQGRLVVLSMKSGDTVFVVGEGRIVECYIDETYLDDKKGAEHLVYFDCKYLEEGSEVCKGCPFNSWSQEFVSGEHSCDGEWGQGCIKGSDLGKTVFLTREDAERALKEGADHE